MLLVWGDDITAAPDPTPGYARELFCITVRKSTLNMPTCYLTKTFKCNALFACVLKCRRWTSHSNGAAARNNNQPASAAGGTGTGTGGAGTTNRAPARHRGTRMVRSVGRGRGTAGVIVGRPLIPANVVPEDLINQVRDDN